MYGHTCLFQAVLLLPTGRTNPAIVHPRYPCVRFGPSLEGVRGQEAAKDGVERGLDKRCGSGMIYSDNRVRIYKTSGFGTRAKTIKKNLAIFL